MGSFLQEMAAHKEHASPGVGQGQRRFLTEPVTPRAFGCSAPWAPGCWHGDLPFCGCPGATAYHLGDWRVATGDNASLQF